MSPTQRIFLRVLAQTPTEFVYYYAAKKTAIHAGARVSRRLIPALDRIGWIHSKMVEVPGEGFRKLHIGITRKGLDALIRYDRANYPGAGVRP